MVSSLLLLLSQQIENYFGISQLYFVTFVSATVYFPSSGHKDIKLPSVDIAAEDQTN